MDINASLLSRVFSRTTQLWLSTEVSLEPRGQSQHRPGNTEPEITWNLALQADGIV